MAWTSVVKSIFSYLLLPLSLVLRLALIVLAPVIYLGSYIVAGALLPLKVLAKFETIYIYVGVALFVGLVMGSILHFSSSVFISLLDLSASPEFQGRTAASVRAAREQKKLEGAWEASLSSSKSDRWRGDATTLKRQAGFGDGALRKRGERKGLLGQTILEEDDDSEDGF
ncbi:hypothetical protein BGZ60DRAFT_524404 [Tricladium varicosporioides]|nr:hypothetical protein BGZ60DRAFT_524404 [Hymenoscyphus varicosporioides]